MVNVVNSYFYSKFNSNSDFDSDWHWNMKLTNSDSQPWLREWTKANFIKNFCSYRWKVRPMNSAKWRGLCFCCCLSVCQLSRCLAVCKSVNGLDKKVLGWFSQNLHQSQKEELIHFWVTWLQNVALVTIFNIFQVILSPFVFNLRSFNWNHWKAFC